MLQELRRLEQQEQQQPEQKEQELLCCTIWWPWAASLASHWEQAVSGTFVRSSTSWCRSEEGWRAKECWGEVLTCWHLACRLQWGRQESGKLRAWLLNRGSSTLWLEAGEGQGQMWTLWNNQPLILLKTKKFSVNLWSTFYENYFEALLSNRFFWPARQKIFIFLTKFINGLKEAIKPLPPLILLTLCFKQIWWLFSIGNN